MNEDEKDQVAPDVPEGDEENVPSPAEDAGAEAFTQPPHSSPDEESPGPEEAE